MRGHRSGWKVQRGVILGGLALLLWCLFKFAEAAFDLGTAYDMSQDSSGMNDLQLLLSTFSVRLLICCPLHWAQHVTS